MEANNAGSSIKGLYGKDGQQIYLGDAIEILHAIPDESVDLIFADPPYNIGKDFAGRKDRWETDEDYYGSMYEPILFCVKDRDKYSFNADSILVEAKTGAKRKPIDYRKKSTSTIQKSRKRMKSKTAIL